MAPVVDALAVDRLANLFGTGGAHRARVLEETQAALLERQAAVFEQAPHFGFGVVDHAFVDDAVDAAGEHAVEVRHQLDIVGVVAADIVQAVGEALAAGEVLLEAGEAAGQRMPARVDELRVGQDQLDQADVQEIVRHLVDEERRIGLALDPRVPQITFAEGAQRIGIHPFQHIVVRHGLADAGLAAQFAGDRGDLRQLHGAFDRGVAGQDLLEQGGTGARQADDEDRIGRVGAEARAPLEERAGITALDPRHPRRSVLGAVRQGGAAQFVAMPVMLERDLVFALVLQRLADREFQVLAVFGGEPRLVQLPPHRGQVVGGKAEGLQVGQTPPDLARTRLQPQAAAIGLDGAILVAGGLQRMAVAHPDPRVLWIDLEDFFVESDGGFVITDTA
jgi:hypothetical protein